MKPRDPSAYADAIHHLAWLCYHDNEDSESDLVDSLGETSALFDGDKTATPEDYVRAACDLLWLAHADTDSAALTRKLNKVLALLDEAHE